MRKSIPWTVLFLALAAPAAMADDYQYLSTSDMGLSVVNVTVTETDLVCIHTGKQATYRDGSRNVVYSRQKPKAGNVFVAVKLQVVNEGCDYTTLDAKSIRITSPTGDRDAMYPVAWFDDQDWRGMDEPVRVYGKAELELAFEVPARDANRLMLRVQDMAVGPVGKYRDPFLDPAGAGVMAR